MYLLDKGISKVSMKKRNPQMLLSQIGQPLFALSSPALEKPSWDLNFFHIFKIPSSIIYEKQC
jgi:hypothetical protein